jgi:serine O-acetyltransferase
MDSRLISQELIKIKKSLKLTPVPNPSHVESFLEDFLAIAFPGMIRKSFSGVGTFNTFLDAHLSDLRSLAKVIGLEKAAIKELQNSYSSEIVKLSEGLLQDAKALLEGDPATDSLEEVLLCYPGVYAVASHRLAHFFYKQKLTFLPRLIAEIAHQKTGIDIHPGAKIGKSFFIDHGTGVVIGQTAVIGDHVKIYQGVTLGALSVNKNMSKQKRHPTIEDGCVIYSHATILGGDTVIGKNSVIGGNVWLTKSVPPNSLVYHKSKVQLDQAQSL